MCSDCGDGVNIDDLPVLCFKVVKQLTVFLAGKNSWDILWRVFSRMWASESGRIQLKKPSAKICGS